MITLASPRKTLARFAFPLLALAALGATPSAQARPLMCGDTLYQSIVLNHNLQCGPGEDGLIIGAHGVRIDLNGFDIRGTADPSTTGVRSYRFDGIEIAGPGRIEGFEWSVVLQDGFAHRISGIEALVGSVMLFNTERAIVERNHLSSLLLVSDPQSQATGNVFRENDFTPDPVYPANAWSAIAVGGCGAAGNVVTGNNQLPAPNPNFGSSVTLFDGAHDNEVSKNMLTRGISIGSGASYNLVSSNMIAVDVVQRSGVELVAGTSRCSGGTPLAPLKNVVSDNQIYDGAYGISVRGANGVPAADNQFHRNTISKPKFAGIWFGPQSVSNDGRKNKIIGKVPYAIDQGVGNLWP